MQDEIKKVGRLTLYDEPYEKTVSDSGIVFYNLDINTAVLEFTISKNNFPLQISDENVDTYVYLEGTDQNGNSYGRQLDVEYVDPFKGLVRLTVPDDYLKAVNGSIVTGQMYIGVHKENRVLETKADTAVLNEFKFTVKDALINSVSAVTKIEYIRMFDKLKDVIKQRVKDIEDAIANGSDYVAQMKNVLADGLKQINTTVTQAKKDVNDTATSANNSITTTSNNAVNTVTQARDDVLNAIKNNQVVKMTDLPAQFNALSWQKYKLTEDNGNVLRVIDKADLSSSIFLDSLTSGVFYFNAAINGPSPAGFINVYIRSSIKRIELRPYNSKDLYIKLNYSGTWSDWTLFNPDYSTTLNWQKYKLTNDDGTLTSVSGLDLGSATVLNSLKPGVYYGYNFINAPVPAGFLEVFSRADNTIKRIELKPYNTKDTYVMTYTNSTWSSWQLMNAQPTFSDTGWVSLKLMNGAKSNTEYSDKNGFECAYRIVTNGTLTTNYLRINGSNFTNGQTIAQLPPTMVKNAQSFVPRTPTSKPMSFITVYPDGTVAFFVNGGTSTTPTTWDSSGYVYGEFSWTN
ncbi:BppU family phage baseplate upper protein [Staphylococcus caprae]|uniref:BppU family phage baseplate upper protein n=1 Tax=Staphylococcus caprae TaxID=29380 RepID=UPI003B2115FB